MRRNYYENLEDVIIRFVSIASFLFIFYLVWQYFTNRVNFWRWFIYVALFIIIIVLGVSTWKIFRLNIKKKNLEMLIEKIREVGQEEYIINFINRFGFEGKKGKSWNFRNHSIDWDRINDLERILIEKGIKLKANDQHRDISVLLRHYIQKKEEKVTRESIKKEPQKFVSLTGADFEKLIYRLFTAMDYSVEWIGKSGDQGGDLIANKEGGRVLIQTKCYGDWSTGNKAVQQVVAAMKYYDCSKTMVLTTSYFTPEAIALAKANHTELIQKERLQEMLLDYLGESWG